jgi:hypothetical protein
MNPLRHVARRALTWPTESQHHARRNAMVAATELARRRRELDEVEEFFELHVRPVRRPAERRDVI